MKLPALLIVGAFALSGCGSISSLISVNPTVSPQSALVAANSFDALEVVATGYLQLPLCTTPQIAACRNATAAAKIGPAVRSGRTARNQIEALLQANSGAAINVASLKTLQAAIATLQTVYTQYNIQH
jgi:uncharacterized protein YceK